ncbi:MAG: HNH endonuclease domain-containing protein [Candidatus Micrarchaeaceae archaeon]
METNKNQLIFAFDLGISGIGECVRNGNNIQHINSLLIPEDAGSIENQTKRRRQYRTRILHKKREEWWKQQANDAGIEVLETRQPTKDNSTIKPDIRMLKEFPMKGEEIIYTSCLLRIALLQGHKLEGWQVFKAIWSAIQHRGYDERIPWAKKDIDNKKNEDEQKNETSAIKYKEKINTLFGNNEEYKYPCYLEAYMMGIWDPKEPTDLSRKIGSNPQPARNKQGSNNFYVIPRDLIEKELRELLRKASEQFPKLKGKEDYIIYGPAEKPYASFSDLQYKKYRGKEWEWQGVLSQKVPRFDNRIIPKCKLMPRFNVCKATDLLNRQVTFLMALKNIRYFDQNYQKQQLNSQKINDWFNIKKSKDKEFIKGITCRDWKKFVIGKLNGYIIPSNQKIPNPKIFGRSKFCRPALKILRDILLSGKSPQDIYNELSQRTTNTNPNKGLIKEDYKFLLNMPREWENFTIPDFRYDDCIINDTERKNKISEIINGINNSIVRHRLSIFVERLKKLQERFGIPDKVIIEFVREDFMGEKRKQEYKKIQRENEKERKDAENKAQEIGLTGENGILKMRLYSEQNGIDIYSGKTIGQTQISECEIDHIFPCAKGGSDAYWNKVLTMPENNQKKGDKTPYEWLHSTNTWENFVERVSDSKKLSKKKQDLLTSENAQELNEKYTSLAETAYIAKLSQRIVSLFFHWPQLTEGSERKIFVANGAYTARIRRKYELNSILYSKEDIQKNTNVKEKKRDNPKHHALDALVISLWPDFQGTENKIPAWFNKKFCSDKLENVYPLQFSYKKSVLAETVYGKRTIGKKIVFVTRYGTGTNIKDYEKIENAKKYSKSIFDNKISTDFKEKLNQKTTPTQKEQAQKEQEEWEVFFNNYWKNGKPRKILQKVSALPSNYKEIGKMKGQYFTDKKEHKGQIVYKNENKKWKISPVYSFESEFKKIQKYKNEFKEVFFFRAKQLVKITENSEKIIKGIYKIETIKSNGKVKISTMDGTPISTNINELMEKCKMLSYNPEEI